MPEWVTPLINTVVTPLLVLMVTLLGWVVVDWRADYKKTKALAEEVPALKGDIEDLKEAKQTAEEQRDAAKTNLDTERIEHTATKRELDKARADHKADIESLNAQHVRDIEAAVTKAVDTEHRQHQTTIDNLKTENTAAIQIAVDKAVMEAVQPLKDEIQRLTNENADLKQRQTRVEKRDTDRLGTPSDNTDDHTSI